MNPALPDLEYHPGKTTPWVVWSALMVVIVFVLAAYLISEIRARRLGRPLMVMSQVPEFTLTNQHGAVVRREDLLGSVWVADIIFTRCPGPCAFLSRRMEEVQAALPKSVDAKLVSLTTDPDYDHPEVLRTYARQFHAQDERWWFLTGAKPDLHRLVVEGLKLALQEKEPGRREVPEDLFIHSTLLVVVDRQGRLRASFETLPRDGEEGKDSEAAQEALFRETKQAIVQTVRHLARENLLLTVEDLPVVNASLNGLSAVLLLSGLLLIRSRRREAHRRCMISALVVSCLFLASYVTYHSLAGHTVFREPSGFRPYYLGLLASHVVLAVAVVPLALITLRRAVREQWERHRKLARWTWPIWMYVSVTGVLIYFILYWIYPQR